MPAMFPFQLKRVLALLVLLLTGLIMLSSTVGTGQAASLTRLQHATKWAGSSSASRFTCGTWSVVTSPNASSNTNILYGVAALSASKSWAVGAYINSSNIVQTLIEQWNGTSWNVVTSPNVGSRGNELYSVAIVSANNIWAVGDYFNSSTGSNKTLIEHWNGISWSVVASPNVGLKANSLHSIAAVSASDLWAVGDYFNSSSGSNQTLIEQWNGTSWSVVTSPNVGSLGNEFHGVVAVSASNVWAVGDYHNSSNIVQTLIERWNGTSWSVVTSPNVGSKANSLDGIAAVSASDLWAVGNYFDSSSGSNKTLIEQWNGTSWSVVTSPNVGSQANSLRSIAAVLASDLWAVGNYFDSSSGSNKTLIEQWNGTSWSVVTSPNPGSSGNFLRGVAAVPASNLWAVGDYINSGSSPQTLIEFYC